VVYDYLPKISLINSFPSSNFDQAIGTPTIQGSRLVPAELFASNDGKANLLEVLTTMVRDFNVIPSAVLGTPFLFNHSEGSTSITPAWRKSIWHVRVFEKFLT